MEERVAVRRRVFWASEVAVSESDRVVGVGVVRRVVVEVVVRVGPVVEVVRVMREETVTYDVIVVF